MNIKDFFETIEYNEEDFCLAQMGQIYQGLKHGLTPEQVELYADLKFNKKQMEQIRLGLENGFTKEQVSLYADPKFHWEEMNQIRQGFENGLSIEQIKLYANPNFNWIQMKLFRTGLEIGLTEEQISLYANLKFDAWQMKEICLGLENGLSIQQVSIYADLKFNKKQMEQIRLGLENGLSIEQIKLYVDPKFSDEQMYRIRTILQNGCEVVINENKIEQILYKDKNITDIINFDGYGADNYQIAKKMVDLNVEINFNNIKFCVELEHKNELNKLKDFNITGQTFINKNIKNINTKQIEKLKNAFMKSNIHKGRIPVIVDKMNILCDYFTPESIVKNFNISYTKNILNNNVPLLPALTIKQFYSMDVCNNIVKSGVIDNVASLLIDYQKTNNKQYKIVADYIKNHLDTNKELICDMCKNKDKLEIIETTTINNIRQQLFMLNNIGELNKILEEYDITKEALKCNIPITKTTYDNRTSRILDFNNDSDLVLASNLGYLTNCCQHLDSAGETAMMHGFINKDAGFWVIEDKDNKILAQAEIWVDEKGTLVFDNIEFADTDDYKKRLKDLCGDIAEWAKNAPYDNIIMGTGYNELATKKMEKSYNPKLIIPDYEQQILDQCLNEYDNYDYYDEDEDYYDEYYGEYEEDVYTDTNEGCVYIKKEGIVSDYLLKNYDIKKSQNNIKLANEHLLKQLNKIKEGKNKNIINNFVEKYKNNIALINLLNDQVFVAFISDANKNNISLSDIEKFLDFLNKTPQEFLIFTKKEDRENFAIVAKKYIQKESVNTKDLSLDELLNQLQKQYNNDIQNNSNYGLNLEEVINDVIK